MRDLILNEVNTVAGGADYVVNVLTDFSPHGQDVHANSIGKDPKGNLVWTIDGDLKQTLVEAVIIGFEIWKKFRKSE
ncbi:MAG: hypothetical protein JSR17_07005 [Proteobacteria bacterium]|nr:hypothetical protein [Pseudomonadota bacterium]